MAQRQNIPTVIQEQNSYPGVTNKLLAKRAHKIFVAYNGMDKYFDSSKMVKSGNPVRKDLIEIDNLKSEAVKHFGLDSSKKTILIFGGSLGARSINQAVAAQEELIKGLGDVQLIWQVGKIYYGQYKNSALAHLDHVNVLPFIDRMDYAYSVADVIVSRAGALTISELTLVGKPSLLVPSPNVAEDHQTKNAMALVNEDAALLVKDKEANETMINRALELLLDTSAQQRLSTNLRKLAKPNAREEIADEILKLGSNATQ